MTTRWRTSASALVLAGALALSAVACGGGDEGGGGTVTADGSSTVGPFVTRAAEDFRSEDSSVKITVGISGTGGGFERFCRGETDISNASREISDEEAEICAENGVEYVQLEIANDALTNIVNPENDWATCLTTEELAKIWGPGSKVNNWSQVRDGFPDVPLKLYGAGTDSGTFDYFTDVINGEAGASRSDYSATEDDNVTVQGVAGNTGGLGYLGYSYYEENADTLRAVEVDSGDGCVAPSAETVQDGTYTPLARPLFVYVKKSSLESEAVTAFVRFMLDNEATISEETQFVPLSEEQLSAQVDAFEQALEEAEG
jgi:phosphate transport system substrate-binding protein